MIIFITKIFTSYFKRKRKRERDKKLAKLYQKKWI